MTSVPCARGAVGGRPLADRDDATRCAWLTTPLLAFVFARVLISGSAYLGEIAIPGITGEDMWHRQPDNIWLDVWARFDSGFYLRIAEEGYWFTPGKQSGVAFFPLYPLLISVLAPLFGVLASGVVVSNVFLLGALILPYRLTEFEFDSASATRTILHLSLIHI